MSSGKTAHDPVDLDDISGEVVESNPVTVHPSELIGLLREQFAAQGERVPPEGHLSALARVAAGFLRTSPVPGASSPEGQLLIARSFVIAAFGWWTHTAADFVRLPGLLEDAFHQRETPVPDGAAREMLCAITAGLLRQRCIAPHATAAQLAIADWLVALYLAGSDDW